MINYVLYDDTVSRVQKMQSFHNDGYPGKDPEVHIIAEDFRVVFVCYRRADMEALFRAIALRAGDYLLDAGASGLTYEIGGWAFTVKETHVFREA